MRVAFTGKGGTGKTTIAGAVARQLARGGSRVLAMDCDPNPNLGVMLGLSHRRLEGMPAVLNGLIASGYTHHDPRPAADELVRRYGVRAADGITLVATGKIERPTDNCLCCGSHTSTRALFAEVSDKGRIVVADLEAGLNDLIWVRPSGDDVVVVVAEPSAKAVDIARRAAVVARALGVVHIIGVANRCATSRDAEALAKVLPGPVFAIPEDPGVAEADRHGTAPIDIDPSPAAMAAIGELAEALSRLSSVALTG